VLNLDFILNWIIEIRLDQLFLSAGAKLKGTHVKCMAILMGHLFSYVLPVLINGQSLGKKLNGIVLENKNGEYLSIEKVLYREYIIKPITCPFTFISLLFSNKNRTIFFHDKICRSKVIGM